MKSLMLQTLFFILLLSTKLVAEPLVKIISNPCEFDGKQLGTSGYLGFPNPLEPTYARLFLTVDDFEFNNIEQSVIVKIPDNLSYKRELYSNKFVEVSGEYNCDLSSHGNYYSGGFESVNRIDLLTKNPNYSLRNFSNGEIKKSKKTQLVKYGKKLIKELKMRNTQSSKYSLYFEDNKEFNENKKRFEWIFSTYLNKLETDNYEFCDVYEFVDQEDIEKNGILDGFICFSKISCSNLEYHLAEELPDWSQNKPELCLAIESDRKKVKISSSQFY